MKDLTPQGLPKTRPACANAAKARSSRCALTTDKLRFHTLALAEWKKLDGSVRAQFKKKLEERLLTPRVASAALSSMPDGYRIKLRAAGDRLV